MLRILALAAFIWWGGKFLGWSKGLRGALLAVLFAAVMALQLTLPEGHGLRQATGGSATPWLLLGGFGLLALGYGWIISTLKARAQPKASTMSDTADTPAPLFSETELNRYARHIVLRELGGPGQKKLKQAKTPGDWGWWPWRPCAAISGSCRGGHHRGD